MNRATIEASARPRLRHCVRCLCLGLFVALAPSLAAADNEWGTVRFRVRCPDAAANNLPNDGSLKVDVTDGAVANVVFWVRSDVPRIHPSYELSAKNRVTILFDGDQIRPRVATYRLGQELVFQSVFNESQSPLFPLSDISSLLPPGASFEVHVKQTRVLPQEITCVIRPKARAYLKVLSHPYGDLTDPDGTAELRNLPVGEHELQFWHERVGYLHGLRQGPAAPPAEKGRFRITVKPGMNDLGEVTIPRRNLDP
jgi:hypothetical protein